ncbi:MAG: peptide-methionine (R)-S-oxide reductase MsrB [Ruminococcaceae bacterium]|nr:peptide-methionine (R)-S-oxide reductase MsrB [Oscillospiraceae bacterium]
MRLRKIISVLLFPTAVTAVLLLAAACGKEPVIEDAFSSEGGFDSEEVLMNYNENIKEIYLGAGCFWGTEEAFRLLEGVVSTEVGYANGGGFNTSYSEISKTGHAEVLKLRYDSNRIHLAEILDRYFLIIDPFSINRQGNDIGRQYRTGIYYTDISDLPVIKATIDYQNELHGREVAVETEELKNYVRAEEYHQKYLVKNPGGYCHINPNDLLLPLWDSDSFIKPDDGVLKESLGDLSYGVTQKDNTEAPFSSVFNNETGDGIYVDIVSGEPLFSSIDKFDAGCGWPSFYKPIFTYSLKSLEDDSHGMNRTEVRSETADSHLGHVFNDGPEEHGGLRHCINGAALRFIPLKDMKTQGYARYIPYTLG